jgi:hypothetical protein
VTKPEKASSISGRFDTKPTFYARLLMPVAGAASSTAGRFPKKALVEDLGRQGMVPPLALSISA